MTEYYRPCPFCGAKEGKPEAGGPITLALNDAVISKRWSIDCLSCGAQGPRAGEMMAAVEMWNDRKGETA